MLDLNALRDRILQNKRNKGFPIGDYEYDLNKMLEEIEEVRTAAGGRPERIGEEVADLIILAIGIGSYTDVDIERVLLEKMSIIEKRKIIKVSDKKFDKEEGE